MPAPIRYQGDERERHVQWRNCQLVITIKRSLEEIEAHTSRLSDDQPLFRTAVLVYSEGKDMFRPFCQHRSGVSVGMSRQEEVAWCDAEGLGDVQLGGEVEELEGDVPAEGLG